MTDNSNSSLFGDLLSEASATPAASSTSAPVSSQPDPAPVTETVSDTTLDSVLSAIRTTPPPAPITPIPTVSAPPAVSAPPIIPDSASTPTPTTIDTSSATPALDPQPAGVDVSAPQDAEIVSQAEAVSIATPVAEILTPQKPVESVATVAEVTPPVPEVQKQTISDVSAISQKKEPLAERDEKLERYMEQDVIYQSMLRVVDEEEIRLRLAIRYMIMMFAVFLVAAWVVNNRIIMFGFSEFQILSRMRDALFGMIAGLFALTLWFGSEVWFRQKGLVILFRTIAILFFTGVLSALYFPFWSV